MGKLPALKAPLTPFQKSRPNHRRALSVASPEKLEDRVLLIAPRLVSVLPDVGEQLGEGAIRNVAPRELTIVFDNQQVIDNDTVEGIRIKRADFDGEFDGVTDVMIGYIGVDPLKPNEVNVRFASALTDGFYQIEIFAKDDIEQEIVGLRNTLGELLAPRDTNADREIRRFELDLGAQLVSVVPQPTQRVGDTLVQHRDQIELYFNDDDLDPDSAVNPEFYRLIYANDLIVDPATEVFKPTAVSYDSVTDKVTLTFESDIEDLGTGAGIYRLRVGTQETIPQEPEFRILDFDPQSSFDTAHDLGAFSTDVNTSKLFVEAIEPADPGDIVLEFPGSNFEPGHGKPNIVGPDETPGIQVIEYNFVEEVGFLEDGTLIRNLITETQKERTRDIFALYEYYLGVHFIETADSGIIIATGDQRGPQAELEQPLVMMDQQVFWDESYGETLEPNRTSWMEEAMISIGEILGFTSTEELPPWTLFGGSDPLSDPLTPRLYTPSVDAEQFERIYPGKVDVLHGRHMYRPESNDIDLYRFEIGEDTSGVLTAETIAERHLNEEGLRDASLLDSVITLYREDAEGGRSIVARNDDYFSEDSFIELEIESGVYYLAVTSTGNVDFDPTVPNSGFGGQTQGEYELRLDFKPRVKNFLIDQPPSGDDERTGVAFDGDADGVPGGVFHYWFQANQEEDTVYVDKSAAEGGDGSISSPFKTIKDALTDSTNKVESGDILRIVGNEDNLAYEIGVSGGVQLPDGGTLEVPAGVTVMVDRGAIFKMLKSNIHVGSSAVGIDRSESALQILGTPDQPVIFSSYNDESVGNDSNPRVTLPSPGDWGGIIFQNDVDRAENRFDHEQNGVFLNHINNADLRYGGGNVTIGSVQTVVDPVHMIDARPTVSYNKISYSADAAMSANPDSFETTRFTAADSLYPAAIYQTFGSFFTPDFVRVGPDLRRNELHQNTTNGIFVRIDTPAGDELERMTVTGRWDDTDIVHVVSENLVIEGTSDRPIVDENGNLVPRTDAGLKIDPAVVVKLDGARIEATIGAQLLAEGTKGRRVVFTSLLDVRYGAGGTFNTSGPVEEDQILPPPRPGDWGGIYVGPTSNASIDYGVIAYAGGLTRIEGSFAGFNAVEVHQGDLRLTNSIFESNQNGRGGQAEATREGRYINGEGAVFVRAATPIIVNNIFKETQGFYSPAINIDVNSLDNTHVPDPGRSTGNIGQISRYRDNQGALIRANKLTENSVNGMVVRGGHVLTQSVWDDTDIVHVVLDEIIIPNFHTFGGLRLESSADESLVVKSYGNFAGFKATGRGFGDEDRIGGSLHVVGQPGRPVILTSLADDTAGAGFDPFGVPQSDTDGFRREPQRNPSGSFNIDLNFGPNALNSPKLMDAVEEAARVWERLLDDPIDVVLDIEMADLGDGILGQATSEPVAIDYDALRDALIADAGAHEQFVNDLPIFADFQADLPSDPLNPYAVTPQTTIATANARALGFQLIGQQPSAYDPNELLDGTIQFNMAPDILDFAGGEGSFSDYSRDDQILPTYNDFISTAIHEIGHALGFYSVVDNVVAGQRNVSLNTLDLFRFEPGKGGEDFANNPRALDPSLDHVLYDGGYFDPFYLDINGLRVGDIPMSNGMDSQASHFRDLVVVGQLQGQSPSIGLMDPTAQVGEFNMTEADRVAFDLIGYDVIGDGVAGDWRGLTLEQNSNDRNVAILTEHESPVAIAPGSNATPDSAQSIGALGRSESDSDENLRLGIEVHGFLNERNDVDVYSFEAKGGTQIWIDLDRTSPALDTIVELIDANENIVVASNDSNSDDLFESTVFSQNDVIAHGLQESLFNPKDHFSVNPKDAGFRVVLPGSVGREATYHIRVRSNVPDDVATTDLSAGLTSGAYELEVRLREIDEAPGSTVQFADIRYAADGIRIKGLPQHSPLISDHVEELGGKNDDTAVPFDNLEIPDLDDVYFVFGGSKTQPFAQFLDAQHLGNLQKSDRGAIGLSGFIGDNQIGFSDVDFYVFELSETTPIVIDLDYADGISGPSTEFAIYEATYDFTGNYSHYELAIAAGPVYRSSPSSRIVDDQPRPLQGDDGANLSGASFGLDDPYLGSVVLPARNQSLGSAYVLQVIGGDATQCENGQFFEEFTCNPWYRTEPIDQEIRIVDYHVNPLEELIFTPDTPVEGPTEPGFRLEPVPFNLGDVTLFVSTDTQISTYDPFTGIQEVPPRPLFGVGIGPNATDIAPVIGDIALRDNPAFQLPPDDPDLLEDFDTDISRSQRLHAFTWELGDGVQNDATVGNYLWIDLDPTTDINQQWAQAGVNPDEFVVVRGGLDPDQANTLSDDGITTFIRQPSDPAAMPPEEFVPDTGATTEANVGVYFDAITFTAPSGLPAPDVEFGFGVAHREPAALINPQLFPQPGGVPDNVPNILYKFLARDGSAHSADDDSVNVNGVPDRDAEAGAPIPNDPTRFDFTTLPAPFYDPDPTISQSPNAGTNVVEAGVLDTTVVDADGDEVFGGQITGIAFVGSGLFGVTNRGHLFQINNPDGPGATARYMGSYFDDNGTPDDPSDDSAIRFTGATAGPPDVEDGRYSRMLFASSSSRLYAFEIPSRPADNTITRAELAPIFVDGSSSLRLGGAGGGIVGIEFGTVDESLWDVTQRRGNVPFDAGTWGHSGFDSFYFGDHENATGRGIDFAGGAHGSLVSTPFSLEGVNASDLPALYFTYLAMTDRGVTDEQFDNFFLTYGFLGINPQDTLRVYVSDDSNPDTKGEWQLLASTNYIIDEVAPLFDSSFQDVPFRENDLTINYDTDGLRNPIPYGEMVSERPFDPGLLDFLDLGLDSNWEFYENSALDERVSAWRQARLDLTPFAGSSSLRLRFDFSTAGSMDHGGARTTGGSELKAIDGNLLRDGETFALSSDDGDVIFEFEKGIEIINVSPLVLDGETITFSFDDPNSANVLDLGTFEFNLQGDNQTDFNSDVIVTLNPNAGAIEVAAALKAALESSPVVALGITVHQNDTLLTLEGVSPGLIIEQSVDALTKIQGTIGVADGNIQVLVNDVLDAEEVAEVIRAEVANTFWVGPSSTPFEDRTDSVKIYNNAVRIIGRDVSDQGPLGLNVDLAGEENGVFNEAHRFLDNRSWLYEFGPDNNNEETAFTVQYEGIYIDDIVIGFRGRGEIGSDQRTPYSRPFNPDENAEQIPDVFGINYGGTIPDPTAAGIITTGNYELEIRRGSFIDGSTDPITGAFNRYNQSVSLFASAGLALFDGHQFTIGDGIRSATFEYEDAELADDSSQKGVTPGNFAIPFASTDSANRVAATIRDLINSQAVQDRLQIVAATGDGAMAGASTTNTINLFGNVLIDPNNPGINANVYDLRGDENLRRDQGQVIIHSNTISNSRGFGIVVEDGLRDLPETSFPVFFPPGFNPPVTGFDPAAGTRTPQITDGLFNNGDYKPNPGPVRNLLTPNGDGVAPGVVISNNVVAFGGEGGIHFSGDPNGFVWTSPIVEPSQPSFEADPVWPFRFTITDSHGLTVEFEYQDPAAAVRDVTGFQLVPIQWVSDDPFPPTPNCAAQPAAIHLPAQGGCNSRFNPEERDQTDALMQAIESTQLDVTLYRGRGDELFIEGATEIIATNPLPDWSPLFYQEVQPGNVPFGRIVNNTLVGNGGNVPSDSVYRPDDFSDVGILVEDNAQPTLLNNIIANFEHGVRSDLTSIDLVQGGSLFQGNVRNAVNVDTGDFAITASPSDDLFVDWQNGNFYPAELSPSIDSSIESLEDRPNLVFVKQPLGISPSPILVSEYDVLGQLRVDDPLVEPPSGVGENVFKDRGAVDRADFIGPSAFLIEPKDNDDGGIDANPLANLVRTDRDDLTEFIVQLSDLGEAAEQTGAGIQDSLVTTDAVVLLRDGFPLVDGEDYRFEYQATTNSILLRPQEGVWTTGYRYEVVLTNHDQFVIDALLGVDVSDGDQFEVVAFDEFLEVEGQEQLGGLRQIEFELDSGFSMQAPHPLAIQVPVGTSNRSEITDGDIFTINDGFTFKTFEFDSNNVTVVGRERIEFTSSDAPRTVAAAILEAINNVGVFDLSPRLIGDGLLQVGASENITLDLSSTSLVEVGSATAFVDGHVFTIQDSDHSVTFEFDKNGRFNSENTAIPIDNSMTREEISDITVARIGSAGFNITPEHVDFGFIHIGGDEDLLVLPGLTNFTLTGTPGIAPIDLQNGVIPVPYKPSNEEIDMTQVFREALEAQFGDLEQFSVYRDEGFRTVVRGLEAISGALPTRFVQGIRDLAGNWLSTNQTEAPVMEGLVPFDSRFGIELSAPMDFGDAPANYATLFIDNGPRHVVIPGVFLGTEIDEELDGNPSDEANGDAGDDGVIFNLDIVEGGESTLIAGGRMPITVTASRDGKLDAWIDFDGDRMLDPIKENVFANESLNVGPNSLELLIPEDATPGATLVRFRFSTLGNLGPIGRADNGEVEDYLRIIELVEPPVAVSDSFSAREDFVLSVSAEDGLLGNDFDPVPRATETLEIRNPELIVASTGAVTVDADGSFEFTPELDFSGIVTFEYQVTDGVQDSEFVTVTIEVEALPDPPIANDDPNVTTLEDTSISIVILANDRDPDGAVDRDTVRIIDAPSNGSVAVDNNGTATYIPNANFFGEDSFTYTVDDSDGVTSNVATVSITVTDVNDRPIAVPDDLIAFAGTPTTKDLVSNDIDIDGTVNPNSIIIALTPKSGQVIVNPDGTVTYTPQPGFLGSDTFEYTIRDDDGATSEEGAVNVTVSDVVLIPPVADDDTVTIDNTMTVSIDVLANDTDEDGQLVPASVIIQSQPTSGTATAELDGTISYTPNSDFVGVDSLTYTVRDDRNLESNIATVSINVTTAGPPWQNPIEPLDVDADGFIVPLDALRVINEINSGGTRPLPAPPIDQSPFSPPPFIDVNGDDFLAPIDALLVINYLNNPPVAAVAAPMEQIVGAALDIQPRSQERAAQSASVDQLLNEESERVAAQLNDPSSFDSLFDRDDNLDSNRIGDIDDELLDSIAME